MIRRAVFLMICLMGLLSAPGASAADMFGRPEATAPAAGASAAPLDGLPAPLGAIVGRVAVLQSRLNGELRGQLQLAKTGQSWAPVLAILGISFAYGVIHAVGPGHGKLVVGSYFLTRRARLAQGLMMSGVAALVQALSAISLVSLFAWVLDVGGQRIMARAADLEMVSYGVIAVLGLWMGWGVLTGRDCCHGAAAGDHHHHDHDHRHHHDGHACGHDHGAAPIAAPDGRAERRKLLVAGAAVGLRPCSGAILVLLFTLANGIYLVGIASTFAMGLGVAITVSAVSLASLGVHRSMGRLGHHSQAMTERLRPVLAFLGALLITLFGIIQLLGLWSGLITPIAG